MLMAAFFTTSRLFSLSLCTLRTTTAAFTGTHKPHLPSRNGGFLSPASQHALGFSLLRAPTASFSIGGSVKLPNFEVSSLFQSLAWKKTVSAIGHCLSVGQPSPIGRMGRIVEGRRANWKPLFKRVLKRRVGTVGAQSSSPPWY